MLVLESRRLGGLLVILISILLLSFSAPKTLHLSPTVSQNHPSDTAISRLYRPHVKRDQELRDRFGSLVCKGRKYFVKGVSQASRMGINQGPDFGQDAFRDNGWTVSIPRNNVPPTWAPVFENIPPRVPNRDEASFVKLEQDKAFTNNWRQNNEVRSLSTTVPRLTSANSYILIDVSSPRGANTTGFTSPSPTSSS